MKPSTLPAVALTELSDDSLATVTGGLSFSPGLASFDPDQPECGSTGVKPRFPAAPEPPIDFTCGGPFTTPLPRY